MFRLCLFLLLANGMAFLLPTIIHFPSILSTVNFNNKKTSFLFIQATNINDNDAMDDGEIPWDFIKQNCSEKKKFPFWNNPFLYFDEPRRVSFLFI